MSTSSWAFLENTLLRTFVRLVMIWHAWNPLCLRNEVKTSRKLLKTWWQLCSIRTMAQDLEHAQCIDAGQVQGNMSTCR